MLVRGLLVGAGIPSLPPANYPILYVGLGLSFKIKIEPQTRAQRVAGSAFHHNIKVSQDILTWNLTITFSFLVGRRVLLRFN